MVWSFNHSRIRRKYWCYWNVFDSDARAHSYFEGGPDPTMFERFRQNIIQTFI
jgi:hypothetical protein